MSYIPNCFKLLYVQCVGVGGTSGGNDGGGFGDDGVIKDEERMGLPSYKKLSQ